MKTTNDMVIFDTREESNKKVNKAARYKQIIEILNENPNPLSAREIATEMCKKGYTPSNERNYAAPRINELTEAGILGFADVKKCEYTGRTVYTFEVKKYD